MPPELGGATPGGVATHQAHLAAGLASAGVGVALLATNALAASPPGEPAREAPFPLFHLYAPATRRGWLDPAYLRRVGLGRLARYAGHLLRHPSGGSRRVELAHLLWYRRYLDAVRPELVHVQHPLERQRCLRLLARLERRRWPLVVTLHSFFGEHPVATIRGVMAPNLAHADRLIAVSPHVAAQAVQLGADPARVRVIPSGVDPERFFPRDRAASRARLGLALDTPLLLFVGNLEPRKAVDRLLAALPLVRQAVPAATLVVIGSGESAGADDQTPRLRRLAGELDLAGAVRFLGRVPADDLVRWYAAADVFVLPSSSEAQGIAALEAMASGLPVVASAVGGLLGTIEDGRTGYLVPFGDRPALARRLGELLSDPARRLAIGAAARAAVVERFSWRRAVAATVDVYREVLAG